MHKSVRCEHLLAQIRTGQAKFCKGKNSQELTFSRNKCLSVKELSEKTKLSSYSGWKTFKVYSV